MTRKNGSRRKEEESVTLVENLLYAKPSGAVHLMGNLAPA